MGINKYPNCVEIKRQKPAITVNEDITKAIGSNYRTLPLFEKGLYEYNYKIYYSLNNNEYLKCRWLEYKKHIEDRVFSPFQFIDIRDYHFYNCKNRYIPSQSIYAKQDFRYKMSLGPGVDEYGQIPIPQDILMKRGDAKIKKTNVKAGKGKKYG
uniref:Uncharacterized protein n=1 Tax=Bombyx mori TaxID=7091 RepID=A0A8R2AL69_BOMMO|nr:uncharacterized protein LOC101744261 [Bombyx mori]